MFSQGPPTLRRCRAVVETVALPYLFHKYVLQRIVEVIDGRPEARVLNVAWYLQALFWWRVMAMVIHYFASKTGGKIWPYWLLTLAAFSATTVFRLELPSPFNHYFDQTSYFLPAFVFGQLFPISELLQILPQTKWVTAGGMVALVTWWYLVFHDNAPGEMVKGECWPYAFDYDAAIYPMLRPGFYWSPVLLGCIMMLVILMSFVPRERTWFTDHGGEGAMCIYLLHGLIFKYPTWLATSQRRIEALVGDNVLFILQLLFAVLTCYILGSHAVRYIFGPFFNFTWLGNYIFPAKASSKAAGIESTLAK